MAREIYTFAPTGHAVATEKQAKQTVKQVAIEFKRQYKKAANSLNFPGQTTGSHLVTLKRIANVCDLYGQPVPDDIKCLLAIYGHAEKQHLNTVAT